MSKRLKEQIPKLVGLQELSLTRNQGNWGDEPLFLPEDAEKFITKLALFCPRLSKVKLDFVTDDCLSDLSALPLQTIDFSGSDVTDTGMCALAELCGAQLLSVGLEDTDITNASLIAVATYCAKLEQLNVNHCEQLVGAHGIVSALVSCVRLQRLRVIKSDMSLDAAETRDVLETLHRRTEHLLELELDGDYSASAVLFAQLFTKHDKIEVLDLKSDELIPDEVLEVVATKCRCLRVLRVEETFLELNFSVGDVTVWRKLLLNNPQLRELVVELEGAAGVQLCEIILECAPRLEYVEIGHMTPESIRLVCGRKWLQKWLRRLNGSFSSKPIV